MANLPFGGSASGDADQGSTTVHGTPITDTVPAVVSTSIGAAIPVVPTPSGPPTVATASDSIDYGIFENAIATWLLSSGLTLAQIFNKKSKVPQPAKPYMTFSIEAPHRVGGPDEWRWSNVVPPPDATLLLQTVGQRELIVSVHCYTKSLFDGRDADGNYTAKQYLSRAQNAIALPSFRDALNAAGMVFVDVQSFVDTSEPMGPVGAGRATMDVRFRIVDSASDTGTFIEIVNPTATLTPS